MPRLFMIGQWKIEIDTTGFPVTAKTFFERDITPDVTPYEQNMQAEESVIDNGWLKYTTDKVQIVILPDTPMPKNNISPNLQAYAAWVIRAEFSPDATLLQKPFACVHQLLD